MTRQKRKNRLTGRQGWPLFVFRNSTISFDTNIKEIDNFLTFVSFHENIIFPHNWFNQNMHAVQEGKKHTLIGMIFALNKFG